MIVILKSSKGGAALEYIIISTFAAVISLASIAFVGRLIKQKIEQMSQKLEIEESVDTSDFDIF